MLRLVYLFIYVFYALFFFAFCGRGLSVGPVVLFRGVPVTQTPGWTDAGTVRGYVM